MKRKENMMLKEMTYEEFDNLYDTDYSLQDLHMEYIMENCHGERVIGNGDALIEAVEEGYLYEAFRESYIDAPTTTSY
jgi:hypothetical protein